MAADSAECISHYHMKTEMFKHLYLKDLPKSIKPLKKKKIVHASLFVSYLDRKTALPRCLKVLFDC